MNEEETRAELIDPKLKECGWGISSNTKILREFYITKGKILVGGKREGPLKADYVLTFNGEKLATIEAKRDELDAYEGVSQAKKYAKKLNLKITFSTNGKRIIQINMENGIEKEIDKFPTPKELYEMSFKENIQEDLEIKKWKKKFRGIIKGGNFEERYYQEIAINKTLDKIAENKKRLLLTLATGTGKTSIAFQICYKLFKSKWNIDRDEKRIPKILFLTHRNILANQAFNEFNAFDENALIRIKPNEIKKNGVVPTNGSIFFTIFQTFMSGDKDTPYFGQYPKDFFDLIIIDECHSGGAKDESNWRGILDYFSQAVHIGLTATPRQDENVNTYNYFTEKVYTYSLKDGIQDGFLTPFKVKKITSSLDEYSYNENDEVVEGEIERGKIYKETDWNNIIYIERKEEENVLKLLSRIDQNEKTIIFCANQNHALGISELINRHKKSSEVDYCVRVSADDGKLGEEYLKKFQDNEKSIPTILTTSHKLSTGVDAKNIRNIVIMRYINSMIEFKQIIGRGTRLFDGKNYFTIYDFTKSYHKFNDPNWDGEPIEYVEEKKSNNEKTKNIKQKENQFNLNSKQERKIIKIELGETTREIKYIEESLFFDKNGKQISLEQFVRNLYGEVPNFFKNEEELKKIWSDSQTRKNLLKKLSKVGYDLNNLKSLQKIIEAEKSDIFDVLNYISFNNQTVSRKLRVAKNQNKIFKLFNKNKQKEFIDFLLAKYIENGIEEFSQENLTNLIKIKYGEIKDALNYLENENIILNIFKNSQKELFSN